MKDETDAFSEILRSLGAAQKEYEDNDFNETLVRLFLEGIQLSESAARIRHRASKEKAEGDSECK